LCTTDISRYRAFDVSDDALEVATSLLIPEGEASGWNDAIRDLDVVAREKPPDCDGAGCP
jgi:A/G-specific adenine glycosylase